MEALPLTGAVVTLARDGGMEVVPSPGSPVRIDGHTFGVLEVSQVPPPHRGESHPDGDELLYVVTGRVDVVVDDGDAARTGDEMHHFVGPGHAFVVPRGAWHRIHVIEPALMIHLTPGPGGGYRPLEP